MAEKPKRAGRMTFSVRSATLALLAVFAAYAVYVALAGLGFDPIGARWDFAVTGALGDSFGPLNTFMATAAALAAIAAYFTQRSELDRVRADSEAERTLAIKRDFETTFFNLLQLLRQTVKEIDVTIMDINGPKSIYGRDALKEILDHQIGPSKGADVDDGPIYRKVYARLQDDLGHYFRLFYQIVRFIDESSVADRMLYVRMLRATLSNTEIVFIALNCMFGGGQRKLKPLVEKYALLHNVSGGDAKSRRFMASFDQSAFGDRDMGVPSDEASD